MHTLPRGKTLLYMAGSFLLSGGGLYRVPVRAGDPHLRAAIVILRIYYNSVRLGAAVRQ